MLVEWNYISPWAPPPRVESYFDFPDMDSPYFAANAKGLKESIQQCMDHRYYYYQPRNATEKIEIIFESRRQPTGMKNYIQFQTEQLQSPFFDAAYVDKMYNALQIWEFSPKNAEILRSKYGFQHVQHVPFMVTYNYPKKRKRRTKLQWRSFLARFKSATAYLMTVCWKLATGQQVATANGDTYNNPAGNRNEFSISSTTSNTTEGIITQYTENCYVQWKSEPSSKFRLHGISRSLCPWKNNDEDEDDHTCEMFGSHQSSLLESKENSKRKMIDVLMFGFLPCSHDNIRERICSHLEKSLNEFLVVCLHQVFDRDLEFFIERSRVILNVPFYQDSSLATHRIDPLLLRGKVVVSLPSSDPYMDSLYSPVVHFAKNESTLARDVRNVLQTFASLSCQGSKVSDDRDSSRRVAYYDEYIQDKLGDISPLCSALRKIF